MELLIQIRSIYGRILFEYNKEGNTIKDTVEEAVRQNVRLYKANLCGADLRGADISGAVLMNANLTDADLSYANLQEVDLRYANLCGARLYEANLQDALLCDVNLRGAILCYAYLQGADFTRANFVEADFREAKNVPYIPFNCPSEGSFIAWKKVAGKLVKLEIPEDAKRSSATTMKCRCDKAKVLSITDLDGNNPIDKIHHISAFTFPHAVLYKVGEMVYPDSFDEDRWNECSHGIHFFINKQDAINY